MEKENEKAEEKEILEEKKELNNKQEIEENNEEITDKQDTNELKNEDITENNEQEKKENQINENSETKKEEKPDIKKENTIAENSNTKSKKGIIIVTVIIIALLFLSTIFAIINMNNINIVKGVYIEEVNLSGLSKEKANNIVNEKIATIENIEIYYGDYNELIKIEDMGIEINSKNAINSAINIGKTNNIIIDNYQILKAMILKTKLDLEISVNEEKLNETIKNIQAEIPGTIKEYSYEIKGDKLNITNGKAGKKIELEQLKEKIIENIEKQFNGKKETIDIPVTDAQPEKIDIDKIYNEIYKEPKDAYIVEDPFELHKEENGVNFKITIEEAKKMVSEEKEKYTIPLKITKPKVEVKDLGEKLFKHTLAKYTTIYDAGDINRGINIGLAAKAINGTILLPGEKFSYNAKVGDTTKEKGYRTGGAYVGGKVVQAYGGGICQLSSTLYNAVLYANLEIVKRYNHSYAVGYVPAGRDATVSYGGKDFKFENTRKYPIKIVASAKNGVVSVSILGIKEEVEYDIELTSTVLSRTPCATTYEKNPNLEEGKEKVIQKGYNGKTSVAYKIVKHNGKTISKTLLSKDTYKPMNRIVEVGTKKVVTQPVVTNPITQPSTQTTTTPTITNTIN